MISAEKRGLHHLSVWIFRDPPTTNHSGKKTFEAGNDFCSKAVTPEEPPQDTVVHPEWLLTCWVHSEFSVDFLLPVHISYGFPSPNKFKVQARTTLPKKLEIRKTCDMLINTDIMSYQIISYYSTLCTLYYVVHHFTFYTNIIFDFANLSGRFFSVSESGVCVFLLELWFCDEFHHQSCHGRMQNNADDFLVFEAL